MNEFQLSLLVNLFVTSGAMASIKGVKQLAYGWQGFGHSEWGYHSKSKGGDIYS